LYAPKIYFQYFVVPAFFYFLLATTCDMKLIWLVWKDRYMNIHDNQ
jgi:transmembrane E3 ubiquitin-protein ligase